jgi:phosphatidylglycerophosphate synthase
MIAFAASQSAGHPFARLGPANRVTFVRAMLIATAAGFAGEPATRGAAWAIVVLAAAAAMLDGVDGAVARRSGVASAFGARIDMEADALLIMALSVLVWQHGKAGAWILAAGLMRYAFVAAGRLLPWMRAPLAPTVRGKTVAVIQVVGLIVAVAPIVRRPLAEPVAAATLATLTWSFAVDVARLWRGRTPEEG